MVTPKKVLEWFVTGKWSFIVGLMLDVHTPVELELHTQKDKTTANGRNNFLPAEKGLAYDLCKYLCLR